MGWFSSCWITLKSSLWFIPSLMVAGAVGLAIGLVELDTRLEIDFEEKWPRFFGASSDGARKVLATIAGSMITVAGVTFSITIVTLSLAANQYSPRILRNFMRNPANQFVLGFFVSLFTYCLIVLRTIRGGADDFIPALSVVAAIVLAVVGICLFIYFIHHSASAIQVSEILASIRKETIEAIESLFPEEMGREEPEADDSIHDLHRLNFQWHPVRNEATGYIQDVQSASLLRRAAKHDTIIRMERSIGEFVIRDTTVASVLLPGEPDKGLIREINAAYAINNYRTIEHDPAFGIRQIVDMAIKALSPGLNDSTTASGCVDHLGAILLCLGRRRIPSRMRYHEEKLRVIAQGPTFESMLNLALNEIRQNAGGNVALMLRILKRLAILGSDSIAEQRRRAVWKHLLLLREVAGKAVTNNHDRKVLNRAFIQTTEHLSLPDAVFIPLDTSSEYAR
jgi:uncharacterized membrane protein